MIKKQGIDDAVQPKRFSTIRKYIDIIVAVVFLVFSAGYFFTQINADKSWSNSFLVGVLFLSASTDGFMMLINMFRKPMKYKKLTFNPSKVTIIIACYNGEKVIGETIEQALVHVPKEQIIVVSDYSKDNTEKVASSYGVQVVRNERNVNKALSISLAMKYVKTEYVLILDDDTHIGKTFIPTNLLGSKENYSAVAFNVMPEEDGTLVNQLQVFEYRKSMILGKSLRASVGAISNISGAIGLFRTKDLQYQATRHSGQFGGEDQQRTMLVHLKAEGRGVAYVDATVYTEPPKTWKGLFKQRAKSWNCSVHETLALCFKIIFSTKTHFLLKIERAYELFVFMTDPLRILYFLTAFLYPINFVLLYLLYLLVETLGWIKTGRKDPFRVVLLSPLYSVFLKTPARFVASFWWFIIKKDYLKKKLHKYITNRKLISEYVFTTVTVFSLWVLALTQASSDISANVQKVKDRGSDVLTQEIIYTAKDQYNLEDDEWLSRQNSSLEQVPQLFWQPLP
ncbi:MAG: glycosyltransferase family 2 protein [Candidatus Pacebacteria bacterium]|jgi:cellulose synthase/poly-beta-1,6-N-acetylglucosamine synthase-like glycosyltransferase|nr:glycosyltransferase family 2 protein [Candidatus Paceibacterota bacterium]